MTPRALSRHNTHLSRYLIAMLRGLDLASRSDEALGKYVVQVKVNAKVKMNDLLEMQIAGAESDLLSTVGDKIEKDDYKRCIMCIAATTQLASAYPELVAVKIAIAE
ncbi:uncharacterized protein LOC106720333 [Papilio machaon]|uniref:uncharacterized protein LOC106720333 n=1 Tax=Papilio machaon TaxID=76193 RepID=UPI001E664F46|nr:uncharacterized protein LOC106720333 [Papilio machaon]